MVPVRRDPELTIRHDLRPGDLGRVVALHGVLYAAEFGLDCTFEGYVAHTVGEFDPRAYPGRDRLWLAETDGRLVGSVGIVGRDRDMAQLRWFLVDPSVRGRGVGGRLLEAALGFCRAAGYLSVHLWTVDACVDAARLYRAAGFRRTEVKPPAMLFGTTGSEERYDLTLTAD
jgi:GNAT superfamily N-acetyltransferase